ncbi:transposable element Tcb1 transposase [Trichonephila clavipes]|nr:transposable element Tcb1 transposase [Trichonephila clavipes]
MTEDDDWLEVTCCGPTKLISRSEGLSTPTTAEFGLLKILELSWKLHYTTRKSRIALHAHIARRVKDLLRRSFGDDRIVCSAATFIMLEPPRSPDLSSCDYWLWGYLKSQVYRDRPTSLGMLKDNIRLQCLTITPDMLYSAVHNIILDCSYC